MKCKTIAFVLFALLISGVSHAGWRDKVNEVKKSAANKYSETKEAVSQKSHSYSDAIKSKKEELKQSVKKKKHSFDEAFNRKKQEKKDEAIERMEQKMIELHQSLIEINKIGFIADEVRVVSGFPPHAEVFFSDRGTTGREDDILLKNKHKKVLYKVLKLLRDTRKIKVAHYEIKRVKIDFTVPPKIILITSVNLNN